MRNRKLPGRFWSIRAAFILPFALCSWAAAQSYTITDIGAAGATTYGNGINNAGQVIGLSLEGGSAFLYGNGTITYLGGAGANALGINDVGQVVGSNGGTSHGFLYSNGIAHDLGSLGGSFSVGYGINKSGQITGGSTISTDVSAPEHAFVSTNGTMKDLGTLGGTQSEGSGINDSGQVTGWADYIPSLNAGHAFLYTNGVMQDLSTLGGNRSGGSAINATGQVTGFSLTSNNDTHAFLYSNGTMKDLGTLGGTYSEGKAINDQGQVVGFSSLSGTEGPTDRAFLYFNSTMLDLNTLIDPSSGWVLHTANGINDAGQIVGNGLLQGEGERAFLLTPMTPEPGACGIALIAALGLLRRRRNLN